MTRQTLSLVHIGTMLFGRGERRIIPVFIAEHVGDVLAPARIARHRGVEQQLVCFEKAVAAGDRLFVGVELGGVHFSEQKSAVGQRLAILGGLQCGSVGVVVAHLPGRGEVDRVVLGEARQRILSVLFNFNQIDLICRERR